MKRALLDAIAAAPDDDGPRLVYSDWLLERNDPLGELIAVQCALARLGADDERAAELRTRAVEIEQGFATTWLGKLAPLAEWRKWRWRFARGFVAELALHSRTKLRDDGAATLAACECLFVLERLSLPSHRIREAGVRALVSSPWLARLVALDLVDDPIGLQGLGVLADAPLDRLAELDVRSCSINDDGAALSPALGLPALRRLYLGGNSISARMIEALAGWLAHVEHLDLSAWLAPGARYLFGAGEDPAFHLEGLAALAAAPLDRLRVLELGKCAFGDGGIERLVQSRSLGALTSLVLNTTEITDAGVATLCAAASRLPALVHLDLWGNPIGDAGARALCEAPFASRLTTLEAGYWRRYNRHGPSEELLTARGRAMLQATFGDRLRLSDSHR